ncbi:MAG: hypothetical protein FJ276_03800 [Planctomycetes bacterium]|nr:hypothetical protein [Planctomycetota bacterium]
MTAWRKPRAVTNWSVLFVALAGIMAPVRVPGAEPSSTDLAAPVTVALDSLQFTANGRAMTERSSEVAGFILVADGTGPQVAVLAYAGAFVACVQGDETAGIVVPFPLRDGASSLSVRVDLVAGETATVEISVGAKQAIETLHAGRATTLSIPLDATDTTHQVRLTTRAAGSEAVARWREIHLETSGTAAPVHITFEQKDVACPPPRHPVLRAGMEQVLIEWDWRMQDGIGTPRAARTVAEAAHETLGRGDLLLEDLRNSGSRLEAEEAEWAALRAKWELLNASPQTAECEWESLWRDVHRARRRIALRNPLARTGPLVFAQDVPGGAYSSHIVSFHGDCARPGGGVFVLEEPGRSMRVRPLVRDQLPQGAYYRPEVSYDGRRILFAYAEAPSDPSFYGQHPDRFYHLYSVDADGGNLTQLTDGPYDDHSPCVLPNGKIIFCSTRRGGFHRCGKGPCPTHTLAICEADGSNVRVVSFHDTHEYDPAVLHDGRVLYTRWDYVDRQAVNFQHLWTVKPDGSDVRIWYGNSTLNPMGIWEARPIPGSHRVMGTACAHHSMPAGSIVLVDVAKGINDLEPITRFTPDVPFYESEFPVQSRFGGRWPPEIEQQLPTIRWPGHCFRSPYPLSEKYCLAAYTFDILRGEPSKNPPHLFGLYLVDCFGNRELLYRDLNISSSWPMPLRPREKPPALPSALAVEETEKEPAEEPTEGTFFVENVYASWTPLSAERITRLRVIQVLPKTTPDMGDPPPGAARGAPGKQVLGTVPVEPDGSAYFRAPARKAVMFQALDEQGRAVQTMYSLVYLQPGENVACVGCHEHGTSTPDASRTGSIALALRRPPSAITPGPDGSLPFSYPLLVQPTLDRHCVACHNPAAPAEKHGGVILTGEPESEFSKSYNALVSRVKFRDSDGPARTLPDQYGARGSKLLTILANGHYDVHLSPQDWERLITWMDANAVFYGTFNREDQARQLRGERIAGPDLE